MNFPSFHHLGIDNEGKPLVNVEAPAALPDDMAAKLAELGVPIPQENGERIIDEDGVEIQPLHNEEFQEVERGINPKDLIGATKVDPTLVPPVAMLHMATAFMDGAVKYGAFNWRDNAVQSRIYIAAAMRHLNQYLDGEEFDPISGVHHLGHAMACCAILLDGKEIGNMVDTRPTRGNAGEAIRRFSTETKLQ